MRERNVVLKLSVLNVVLLLHLGVPNVSAGLSLFFQGGGVIGGSPRLPVVHSSLLPQWEGEHETGTSLEELEVVDRVREAAPLENLDATPPPPPLLFCRPLVLLERTLPSNLLRLPSGSALMAVRFRDDVLKAIEAGEGGMLPMDVGLSLMSVPCFSVWCRVLLRRRVSEDVFCNDLSEVAVKPPPSLAEAELLLWLLLLLNGRRLLNKSDNVEPLPNLKPFNIDHRNG